MRSLTLWMQMSLDGYAEGPDKAFDWPIVRPELHQYIIDELRDVDAFLYGRRLFESQAAFWPKVGSDPPLSPRHTEFARTWEAMPKVVFSRALEGADWNTRVVSDNLEDEVARLKDQPGNGIVLFGGADIASTFHRLGLIDEFNFSCTR
jgi:dihydrofolate reductase